MPLSHSPLKSAEKGSASKESLYPTARLGAVTRKRNEISALLLTPSEANRVAILYHELLEKISTFKQTCDLNLACENLSEEEKQKFADWYEDNSKDMDSYCRQVQYWLRENPAKDTTIDQNESVSNVGTGTSQKSNKSRSTTSSIRIKRLQDKAALAAEQKIFSERNRLIEEARNLELKKQQLLIEEKREEAERENRALMKKKALADEEYNIKKKLEELELEKETLKQDFIDDELSQVSENSKKSVKSKNQLINKQSDPSKNKNGIETFPRYKANSLSSNSDANLLNAILIGQERMSLPRNEPEIFDGKDCTKFRTFQLAFDQQISSKCTSDADKFYFLQKYTSGHPLELVRSCYTDDFSKAYQDARAILKKHYGNEYKIAEAYLKRLRDCLPIKSEDGEALEDFSILLSSCKNMMNNISGLNQLNSYNEIRGLVLKLPYKMRESWRRKVYHFMEQGKAVGFAEFAEFVSYESAVVNVPMCQDIKDPPHQKMKQDLQPKRKTFATKEVKPSDRTKSTKIPCLCCKKENHTLGMCFFLGKKSLEEQKEFINKNKLCWSCLKPGHLKINCKYPLKCSKCNFNHPTCLHRESKPKQESHSKPQQKKNETEKDTEAESKSTSEGATAAVTCAASRCNLDGKKVVCAAVPVRIKVANSNYYETTYMALDGWSTDSFMDSELLKKLKMKSYDINLSLATMSKTNISVPVKMLKNLEIQNLNGDYSVVIPEIFAKTDWPFTEEDSPSREHIKNYSHLKDVPFEFIDKKIGILLGMKMPELIKPLEVVSGKSGEPYASLHQFGWALNGPVGAVIDKRSMCHRIKIKNSYEEKVADTEDKLMKMYEMDFQDAEAGISSLSIDDRLWEVRVNSSVRKTDDYHYEIGLPFRDEEVYFPCNYKQAYARLEGLKKQFIKQPQFWEEYKIFMNTMLESGYAEKVPENEIETSYGKLWYLIHFGVYHRQKGKLRIVFDCSLKFNNVSLNQKLLQGPDLASSLFSVLLKFREEKVAFMSDIKKMFYQVRVPNKDRDYLRFLWFSEGNLQVPPEQYRLKVHVFGAVSSPSCSNYALRRVAEDNPSASKEAIYTIKNNFYVDDLVKSVPHEEDAISLINEIRALLSKGGFELCGFASNSIQVLSSLPREDLSKELDNVSLSAEEDLPYERALGVVWKISQDALGFKIKLSEHPSTKRGVLSAIFSLFDPYGIAIPVIITGRIIFQELCRLKLQWDDPLPDNLKQEWTKWWKEVPLLNDYSIERCCKGKMTDVVSVQLHIFADGSEKAYAAVAYLRYEGPGSRYHCSLVAALGRLVPLGNNVLKTIPRIELNAAKLAVILMRKLQVNMDLEIDKTFLWSDSATVLKYINCESSRFQRFVANRISYIRSLTSVEQWNHIPGSLNPADLASRGCIASNFVKSELWKNGPSFLWKDESHWPKTTNLIDVTTEQLELKKEIGQISLAIAVRLHCNDAIEIILKYSSSWYKTKFFVAIWLKFKQYLRTREKASSINSVCYKDLKIAENVVWKYVQEKFYGIQLKFLKEKKSLPKNDPLIKLNPIIGSDGLLRVGGRQSRRVASYDVIHPIIMPSSENIVINLVREHHILAGHLGRESVLAAVRKKYWIVSGSSLVRKIVRSCIICRKNHGQPSEQIMADLPDERLTVGLPAFYNSGADCFGPITIQRGRGTDKRYGVVFTCLSSRAIHLEVLSSLSTDSFILALRRFVARRGNVRSLRTDNGTNFVGANRELKEALEQWNQNQIEDWCRQKNIDWKFIPPNAPHQGGIWEREIRTIKKTMTALLHEQPIKMTDEALQTLLCEIENILNNRPLTALSQDPQDLDALTPNHLLLLNNGVKFPPGLFSHDDVYARKRWKQVQYLANLFWTRFRREYLSVLQARTKWTREKRSHRVGDLVLVTDQNLPRNNWPTGRIVEVFPDRNNYVRSAKVKIIKHKSGKNLAIEPAIIERPITKLILLCAVEELESYC